MNIVPVKGYEEIYSVSDTGKIYRHYPNSLKEIVTRKNKAGYEICTLFDRDGKEKLYYVHRLVVLSFLPNPENKKQTNHINGNKSDNRLENLEWATPKENSAHAVKMGLMDFKDENNPASKLSNADRVFVILNYHVGWSGIKLSKIMGVHFTTIYQILHKHYKNFLKARGLKARKGLVT